MQLMFLSHQVTAVHEAVHGWFGNLVTCAWWDDVWLNEGMTTYYTDLTLLDIQAWTRQNVRDDINARRYKWLKENWMFALHDETFVEDEWATNVYARGPAVLQMFHKAMGEKFETRLFDYLKSNLYKNVNSTTFINALTKNNESVEREMFNSFIFQYDAPLISIIYDNDTKAFIISQKPIHSSRNTKWTIPIWYQRTETETNSEEMRWLRAADEKLMIPMIEDPENYRFDQECIGFAEYIIEIGQDIALHCSSAAEWSEIDFDM
uniref:Peptidase M1 membrane alanine aminopeptidase domain-containing protein n=1 Tax=Plectus sambesii TaxID=2011161 RepID=A0A914WZP4_9BILA